MKKSVFFLTLLLCLSLIFPGAHAEDTYVPGERMRSLVSSALEAGQLVGGEAHFSLTLPDSMLPDDEEGRAQFDALAEVIQGVSLAGGMGRLDDGYRVELGGAYTAPSGDNVYVTGAANLTADGLSLESNLIEGERLSIRWETLLEMLGLSENEIDALLSLPTTDWDSALNELNDELAQAAETFGKLADPYLVTLADFAATLNIQQRRDVEAENGYPAVENEISITCTAEELSRLLHSLADQVEKDTALRPYLEQLIQNCDLTVTDGDSETTHVMSVSEFCDETRQFADVLAETDGSLGILLGYDDDGLPFYLTLAVSDGETLDALAFQMLPGETEDTCVFTLRALESDGDSANTLLDTALTLTLDPDDKQVYAAELNVQSEDFTLYFAMDSSAVTTEDSLPGYRLSLSMNSATAVDSGTALTVYTGDGLHALTAAGGEQTTYAANIDIYADTTDSLLGSAKIESGLSLEPDENSLVGRFYLDEAFTADDGTLSFGTDVALSSWNYDAAETDALRETMFETATGEELAALQNRFVQSAQQKLFALLSLVPQEVLQMLN
ncbi:MAG: hypothetical protein U0H96_13080 [Christensenellales bacterium]|nr:hypothetical protein [Christensenellales bacterium]